MADYGALDAHSRNCSACRRQREAQQGEAGGRKRLSLQEPRCSGRRISPSLPEEEEPEVARRPGVRRSNSTLSCSSEGAGEGSSYLTPTQRRAAEVRRVRLELGRANQRVEEKDREILVLRRELAALREVRMVESVETVSVTDSGTCEEEEEGPGGHIDFELMETALREEEEARGRLEEENKRLREELEEAREEQEEGEKRREEEVRRVRREQEERELEVRRERSQAEAELVRELAESSLRCARQQEVIEGRQEKEQEIRGQLQGVREELGRSQEQVQKLKVQALRIQEGGEGRGDELQRSKEHLEMLKEELKTSNFQLEQVKEQVQVLERQVKIEQETREGGGEEVEGEKGVGEEVGRREGGGEEVSSERLNRGGLEEDMTGDLEEVRRQKLEEMGRQLVEEKERLREAMMRQLALQRERMEVELQEELGQKRGNKTKDWTRCKSGLLELNHTDSEYLKSTKEEKDSSSQTECNDTKGCSCQQLSSGAGGQVGGQVGGQAGGQVGGKAGGQAGGQVGGQVGGQAGGHAGGQADEKLEDVPLTDGGGLEEKIHFTYQFLRRSVFYFLTDKENRLYHLRSIERLLEFTDTEKGLIDVTRPGRQARQQALARF